MKKKSIMREFNTVSEMDSHLESRDLGKIFAKQGKIVAPKIRKINLDLPEMVLRKIDKIADQIGVARQPLIKMWIHDKLKEEERGAA